METTQEFAAALTSLQRRSTHVLAAFIVSLVNGAPSAVRCYVEAFVAAEDPGHAAAIIGREIEVLRAGEREYDVRHRRGAELVARVGYAVEALERVLWPADPQLARQVLTRLLDSEQEIAAHCYEDDFGAECVFARARALLTQAQPG
jgi:hypothetical protein